MKRIWLYFFSVAFVAELCSTWLQSFHHTYMTQAEYIADRLIIWAVIFVPLMIVAALFARRNFKL